MTTPALFGREKALIGMVHIGALPGTPRSARPLSGLIGQAVEEAITLADAGFDALILENMHDVPYMRREVGPEIVASMTRVAQAVRERVSVPIGVQILAGANRAALAVAHAVGARFIRAEGFVFASIADEGLLDEADAGPLLRYRRAIGAAEVSILADVKKKHSAHTITADVDMAETVRAAEFCGADGTIITGPSTGQAIAFEDLRAARQAARGLVLVGSGVTPDSVGPLFSYADGLIVGSWYKRGGRWDQPADPARVRELVQAAHTARSR